jgi:hypothetical protein
VALQKTFYPNRATSLDFTVIDMKSLVNVPEREVQPVIAAAPKSAKTEEPKEAIRQLAEYEIGFLQTNTSFLEKLRVSNEKKELPEDWKKYTYKSKCNGLLGLASDVTSLQWLIEKIAQNEVHITFWQRFLGEATEPGDDIVSLSYNPDVEAELFSHLSRIFECVQGENQAHVKVDQYLRELESKILSDVKANKIQDVQDGLRELLQARRDYSSFKKDNPDAFYPNTRRWGRKPVFGWDFMDLWERVLKNVCDIIFSGQYPKSVYELLIYLPFSLCIEAIQAKRPKESFQAELFTLGAIFWVIVEKREKSFMDYFLDMLEDLAQEVHDLDLRLKTVNDGEWALSISKEVASYIANLGYLALSGKAALPFDKLSHLLELATSLHFMEILSGDSDLDWQQKYDFQKELDRKLALVKKGYIYAWATYSWHQERNGPKQDPSFAISLLNRLQIKEVISFYSRNTAVDTGWIDSWFRPEGKRASWSWSVDHDVRDSLQLAILTLPVKKEDLEELDMFQVKSSYDTFVKEIVELHGRLSSKGIKVSDLGAVTNTLNEALQYHEEKLKDLIRNQKAFSVRKIEEVTNSFQKSINEHSQEGSLYSVEETLLNEGIKPSHYVGQYFISDKVWYLEETGTSSYSVMGLGSGWAENIVAGRAHVLVMTGKEIATQVEYQPSDLRKTLEHIRASYDENFAMLLSPMTIPWNISSELILNEHQVTSGGEPRRAGRSGKLGKVDIFYNRFLKRGEILVFPKMAFSWVIKEKSRAPKITMIEEGSDEAKQLKEKNPDIDLGIKALVFAREEGVMRYRESAPQPVLFTRIAPDDGKAKEDDEDGD